MGKIKKRESAGLEDVLPEDLGDKLVTSIIDKEGAKRLKALARRYTKHAIASYQEKQFALSLLQIACVIGNVQAAEYLLGVGADKDIRWNYSREGAQKFIEWRWLPAKAHKSFCVKAANLCSPIPALIMQPMHGAQLSILHVAALTNQQHMVRFLVENKHLPVDVRAGGTGVTPLLAVCATRCCTSDEFQWDMRENTGHICCHPTEGHADQPETTPDCESLLGMFELLLELGADPAAVDVSGCGLLAAAAAAGRFGLWDFLATEQRMRWFDMRTVHASHVLLRAAQYNTAVEPEPVFFDKAVTYLQQLYTAHGVMPAFMQQLKEPAPVFVYESDQERSVQPSHPLRAAMEGCMGAEVVHKVLDLGVSLDALRAGLEELPVGRPCPVESALVAVLHGHGQGEPSKCHGRVLMALFLNCCMYTHPAAIDEGTVSGTFGMLVEMMSMGGIDFRDRCWWPAVPETLMRPGRGTAKSSSCIPASPLVFAVAWNCKPAVAALIALLDKLGDTDFINECGPDGQTPLIAAAAGGNLEICKVLVEAGADVCKTGRDSNWPLFAAASLTQSPESAQILIFLTKKLVEIYAHRQAEVWELLHQSGPGRMTVIQRLLHSRQDTFVIGLAPVMDPLLVYTPPNPLRIACLRSEAEANKGDLLTSLVSSKSHHVTDALTEHDSEHGLTVLGQAVAWGHDKTVELLARTCKQQYLQLAPLLERHIDRSPFSTPLFNAIIHHYPDTLRSLAANGLELTPQISAQHLLLSPEALQAGGRLAGREFVRAPRPGETESISLLECAASAGNLGAVKMLLSRGVDAREEPFPGNRWYRNALTAAIDFPEMAGFPGGEELPPNWSLNLDGSISNMGTKQLACVQELLKAGGAMTEEQMYRVLDVIYQVSDTQVGVDMFSLMRKLAMCRQCKLVGCWRKCSGGCCSTFYCSVACQTADWLTHQQHCRPVEPALDSTPGTKAVTELATTFTKLQLGV